MNSFLVIRNYLKSFLVVRTYLNCVRVLTPETISQVEALVIADRDLPIDRTVNTALSNTLNLSASTWARILKDDLRLKCFR